MMNFWSGSAIWLAASLAGCSGFESDDKALIAEAKIALASELADPTSAQFQSVRVPEASEDRINGIVCGQIVGQFKDGVQGQPRRFLFSKLAEFAGIEDRPLPGEAAIPEGAAYQKQFDELWQESCAKTSS
jgi:hypothetical protein